MFLIVKYKFNSINYVLLFVLKYDDIVYLYSRLDGGGARDKGIGLKEQLAGFISDLLVPCSLQLR